MKTVKILGDTSNKVDDTATIFRFRLWKDNSSQDVSDKKLSATIANSSGYLFDITPINSGIEVWIDFNDERLKTLTPDDYQMEIRVTNTDGDIEIYPSNGSIPFTVTKNLRSSTGQTVPYVTFDEVLKQVDEKVNHYISTIAKGDKGDIGPKGDKGNTGDRGPQGIQGVAGKDFEIAKTFSSVKEMSGTGLSDGDFVMVSSDVEDVDNAKLYIWNGKQFNFISDLSGSQGIKGETGPQGVKGDTGPQGPKGDKGDTGELSGSIGGRNYILNSLCRNITDNQHLPVLVGASPSAMSATLDYNDEYFLISNAQQTKEWGYELANAWQDIKKTPLKGGVKYILSAEVKGTSPQVVLRQRNKGNSKTDSSFNSTNIITSEWTKVSLNFSFLDNADSIYIRIQGGINGKYQDGFSGGEYLKVRNIKLEEGTIPTDWTPAPEDKADDASVVHVTGNETITGAKTFSDKLTVNGVSQADLFYKHLKKGTMSTSIMEVLDDNLDGTPRKIGKYYSSDTYGNGVAITGYGLTGIGGGESIAALFDKIQVGDIDTSAMPLNSLGDESLVLASDSFIYLFPGQQKAPNYNGNWRFSGSGYIDRYDTASKKWVNIIGNNTGVLAEDSKVVHNSGNESVSGNKTFTGTTKIGGTTMTDSGWKNMTLTNGAKADIARYRLLNGIVYIEMLNVVADVGSVFFTLPSEYMPSHDIWQSWFAAGKSGNFMVDDKGQVSRASSTTSGKDSGTKASFEVCYPIN